MNASCSISSLVFLVNVDSFITPLGKLAINKSKSIFYFNFISKVVFSLESIASIVEDDLNVRFNSFDMSSYSFKSTLGSEY